LSGLIFHTQTVYIALYLKTDSGKFCEKKKVKKKLKALTEQAQWEQQNLGQNSSSFMLPQAQPPLQPSMLSHPPPTIGYALSLLALEKHYIYGSEGKKDAWSI